MQLKTKVAAGAAVWVGEHLESEPHEGTVIHAGTDAVYFTSEEEVLAVVSRRATRVPLALVTALPDLAVLGGKGRNIRTGDRILVGEGLVRTAGADVRVGRYIDYRLPPFSRDAAGTMRTRLLEAGGPATSELDAPLRRGLIDAPAKTLEEVLGRGSGLTPFGDDVVCGMLAALLAAGDPCTPEIAARVRSLAPGRTTRLSAALLRRAAEGDVLLEFARVVNALLTGSTTLIGDLDILRSVGHTSGAGMLLGLDLALTHILTRNCS